jgi:hypothetical protein
MSGHEASAALLTLDQRQQLRHGPMSVQCLHQVQAGDTAYAVTRQCTSYGRLAHPSVTGQSSLIPTADRGLVLQHVHPDQQSPAIRPYALRLTLDAALTVLSALAAHCSPINRCGAAWGRQCGFVPIAMRRGCSLPARGRHIGHDRTTDTVVSR